jgi:hypothetical protein
VIPARPVGAVFPTDLAVHSVGPVGCLKNQNPSRRIRQQRADRVSGVLTFAAAFHGIDDQVLHTESVERCGNHRRRRVGQSARLVGRRIPFGLVHPGSHGPPAGVDEVHGVECGRNDGVRSGVRVEPREHFLETGPCNRCPTAEVPLRPLRASGSAVLQPCEITRKQRRKRHDGGQFGEHPSPGQERSGAGAPCGQQQRRDRDDRNQVSLHWQRVPEDEQTVTGGDPA